MAELIEPNSKKDSKEAIFFPESPLHVVRFFQTMGKYITLQTSESGVSFRESKYNLIKLFEREGYDYEIYQNFIEHYEKKLLEQYHES